jgi:hypothetical protein
MADGGGSRSAAVETWKTKEVAQWLGTLRLAKSASSLESAVNENHLDGEALQIFAEMLVDMSKAEALRLVEEQLLVKAFGDQLKIVRGAASLVQAPSNAASLLVARQPSISRPLAKSTEVRSPLHALSQAQLGFRKGAVEDVEYEMDDLSVSVGGDAMENPGFEAPVRINRHERKGQGRKSVMEIGADVLKTAWNWRDHFRLVVLVLGITSLIAAAMWFYAAPMHGACAFYWFSVLPHFVFAPPITVCFARLAAPEHLTLEHHKRLMLGAVAIGLVSSFGFLGAPFNGALFESLWIFRVLISFWCVAFWWSFNIYITTSVYGKALRWKGGTWFFVSVVFLTVGVNCYSASSLLAVPGIESAKATYFSLLFVSVFVLTVRTALWDTVLAIQQDISLRLQGPYLFYLIILNNLMPWTFGGLMSFLLEHIGHGPVESVFVLVIWGFFLVVVYLNGRLVATRCLQYKSIPLGLLSLQIAGDLFTEMVSPASLILSTLHPHNPRHTNPSPCRSSWTFP